MKKLFFVKKNVNEPTGTDNWIEMNVDEFKKFIETEAGRNRRNNFAPLLGFGTGDADYYIETTREEVSKIRKDNNRHAYLKKLEMESGFVTVSLNELDLFGENEQEDRIVDMTAFVDKIFIAKETSLEIQKALSMLTDKQRDIICSLVYTDEPVRVIDYAKTHNMTSAAVIQTKERALKQLKKILINFGIGGLIFGTFFSNPI